MREVDVKVELGLSNYTYNYIELKTFQYYVAAARLSDNKQKQAVLLDSISPAGKEIFDILFDTEGNYEWAIASLDNYFMPMNNLIYERHNFLIARQNSAETIDVYVTRLRLLTKPWDYDSFKEEMIRNHVGMSCVSFRLRRYLLRENNLSLELLQTIAQTIELRDHQTSKMESFQQHDDSINATKRLTIEKKTPQMIEVKTWNALGAGKVDISQIMKSVKREMLPGIHVRR